MPWGDGTGPWWARGYGCGIPFGFRRFRRFGWARYPSLTKEEETEMLKEEKEYLQAALADIEKRLNELK